MAFRVVPYTRDYIDTVAAFNSRLLEGGVKPALLPPLKPPDPPTSAVYYERFLVLDGEHMRGAYMLQRQPFWVAGEQREVANLQGPISEGIVNKKYVAVAPWMLKYLAGTHPLLFGVGMGGLHMPLARLLKSLGWRVREVPFLFRVQKATRFLQQIGPVREKPRLRRIAQVLATTRLGGLIHIAQWRPRGTALKAEVVQSWNGWSDRIWTAARSLCSFSAVRDSSTLDGFHPQNSRDLHYRLEDAGWVVLRVTDMNDNAYFGDLRVGTVVDALAMPGQERRVVETAIRLLTDLGAELMLTNQLHPDWVRAFKVAGFWTGPSNYLFAESPPLAQLNTGSAHLNRADGDGRYHL